MPEDSKAEWQQAESEEKINMPDFIELWKELYFQAEESWANVTKEIIGSKGFIRIMDEISKQYLSFHKISQQNTDKYFEANPLPSKKDIARIAELIIGLEDKVDDFDLHFSKNIVMITNSMVKLVDYQEVLKQEIAALKQENSSLNKKLETLNKRLNTLVKSQISVKEAAAAEDKKPKTPNRSKKKDSLD